MFFKKKNTNDQQPTKKEIRDSVKSLRRLIPLNERKKADDIISEKVLQSEEFKQAKSVFIFMSFDKEISTRKIISQALEQGKTVGVPRISGGLMNFFLIEGFHQIEAGFYGIGEPIIQCPFSSDSDLIIVPGVAFDEKKHRIGYGGGYYDKYLALHPTIPTIAIAYDMQILKSVPYEDTDIFPNKIFTEKRTIL